MLEPETPGTVPRRETVDRIRQVIQRQDQGMVAGEPVMVVDGFRYLEQDGRRLGWATRGLLAWPSWLALAVCGGS